MPKNSYNFNIFWTELCSYPTKPNGFRHSHDFFHFVYVSNGHGFMTIGDNTYPLVPGNIYATPPFVEHSFHNSGEEPLRTLEIKFDIDDIGVAGALKNLIPCMDVKDYPIEELLSAIRAEEKRKQSMYKEVIDCQFQLFVTYLLRCNEKNSNHYTHVNIDNAAKNDIDRAIDFINENLSYDITLVQLANATNFEKNYFIRKFKEKTGKTPMIYVRDRRIVKAKQLLEFSDMNITQIAYETGFKTIHYFSKTFFDCTGKRPLDYRKEKAEK